MSQESEKNNQLCYSYTNYNDSNTTIYNNLISSFENHLLTEAQINAFTTYMKGNCDQNFTKDIMYILEDYNSLLYQSIQAIKSLLSENSRLIQNQTLSCLDNTEKKEEEKEELAIEKIQLKRPLREQIKVMAHSKKVNGISDRNEEPLKVSALTEDVMKEETNKEELLKLKETNDILKQIEVTQANQSYFVKKYTQNKNIDISEGYKEFLQNIIEYKYELYTLKQIKQDIITMKQTSKNYNRRTEKKLNNQHYIESISPYTSQKKFTDSLRLYSNQTSKEKPPFVPFTSPYSRLFSRENKG